jgi:8-oxo-dGTP pyrophosphatase MutT (NUDIX family)
MNQPVLRPPAIPSTAATLVILRDRTSADVEALLLQRHAKSKFAAGDYVFAGGKIEADDMPPDGESFCRGLTAAQAAARLGGGLAPRDALACWVGAIREAFEEVGVLLAYEAGGTLLRITPAAKLRYEAYRAACQKANPAFFDMLRAEKLTLATDRLAYFAHWITPEEQPLRFDTRFFAAVMPSEQEPVVDGHEIVDLKWLTPAEAISASKRKEIGLRTPTIKNLELVAGAGAPAAHVVTSLGAREVPTIRPRVLQVDGKPVPVLPGDPRWY